MRNYFALPVLLIAILGGIFFLLPLRTRDSITVSVQTVSEHDERSFLYAEYPHFPHLSKEFNARIEAAVSGQMQQFRDSITLMEAGRSESWGSDMPEYEYTLSIGWYPTGLSPHIVSFVLRSSYFTGGAHGGHELFTFTYDTEKGRELLLSDVFASAPKYLERISQYVVNDLKVQLERRGGEANMSMLIEGTAPREENFRRFTLHPNGAVTFYFPEYQVAPYAYGEQSVTMPLSFILSDTSVTPWAS